MFHKILVPLDGSILAEAALEPAFALALPEHGEIVAVRVPVAERIMVSLGGTQGVLWPDQSLAYSVRETRQYLTALQKSHSRTGITLRVRVGQGEVADGLLAAARAEDADLICMATHGHMGLTRWMAGSIAERVLAEASCPVLVVRSRRPLRRVLITLDGSALAEQALRPGLAAAAALGAEVLLLRVVAKPVTVTRQALDPLDRLEQGLGRHLSDGSDSYDEASAYLQDVLRSCAGYGLAVSAQVRLGSAAAVILEEAGARQIDLICMATRGRSGVRRLAYGSVTDKVLHGASAALLVIRPGIAYHS